ncbi:hypothetical protein LG314_01230 [Agrococcus terreus]|uniref:hypothetical protein n=1 Tax=Agrococcus terreus TaxID=574649 RepID=UPI00384E8AD5
MTDTDPDFERFLDRGFRVPLDGSEEDAVASVLEQLNGAGGPVAAESEVLRFVQAARAGAAERDDAGGDAPS